MAFRFVRSDECLLWGAVAIGNIGGVMTAYLVVAVLAGVLTPEWPLFTPLLLAVGCPLPLPYARSLSHAAFIRGRVYSSDAVGFCIDCAKMSGSSTLFRPLRLGARVRARPMLVVS